MQVERAAVSFSLEGMVVVQSAMLKREHGRFHPGIFWPWAVKEDGVGAGNYPGLPSTCAF